MKKLITILALLIPTFGFGQYVHYHHYPSDSIAEQITKGKIKKYCSDTVELVIESSEDKEKTSFITSNEASEIINKILSKGIPTYGGRTNMGYSFSIFVYHKKDDMKIYRLISFKVDQTRDEIYKIIISKQI